MGLGRPFGGGKGRDPYMEMVLSPGKVKPKGQQKDLTTRWKKFYQGKRNLGYTKRHKKHGDKYSDLRDTLAEPGANRRLRDIAMLRMNQERKWAAQGIDRPAYMEFQEKVKREGKHKQLKKARKYQRKALTKKGKKRRKLEALATSYRKSAGVNIDPARTRARAITGDAGQQLRLSRNARFAQASPEDKMNMTKWVQNPVTGDATPTGRTQILSKAGQKEVNRRMKARQQARRAQ